LASTVPASGDISQAGSAALRAYLKTDMRSSAVNAKVLIAAVLLV
jgi:hypothetical protein